MFELEKLHGNPPRSIRLDTRSGNAIKNEVSPPVGDHEYRNYELLKKRYGQNWQNRKAACGTYNCFGMVFASRRTSIYEISEVEKILSEDRYELVTKELVRPGDIAVYRRRSTGEVDHVACVVHVERFVHQPVVFALSKWDDHSGEDRHNILHHCWIDFDPVIEFRRERE